MNEQLQEKKKNEKQREKRKQKKMGGKKIGGRHTFCPFRSQLTMSGARGGIFLKIFEFIFNQQVDVNLGSSGSLVIS